MREKDQVGADIYIEDAPENIYRLRTKGHFTICYVNSTNTAVAAPRATSWEEVYALIHEREKGLLDGEI
jgi:hypothetical protein